MWEQPKKSPAVSPLNSEEDWLPSPEQPPTLNGDTNLDRLITFDDYFNVDLAKATSPPDSYHNGDCNFDRLIDASDYALIDKSFISQSMPLSAVVALVVPVAELSTMPPQKKTHRLPRHKHTRRHRHLQGRTRHA